MQARFKTSFSIYFLFQHFVVVLVSDFTIVYALYVISLFTKFAHLFFSSSSRSSSFHDIKWCINATMGNMLVICIVVALWIHLTLHSQRFMIYDGTKCRSSLSNLLPNHSKTHNIYGFSHTRTHPVCIQEQFRWIGCCSFIVWIECCSSLMFMPFIKSWNEN